jgi:MYXO-CTERM domain-containing protein
MKIHSRYGVTAAISVLLAVAPGAAFAQTTTGGSTAATTAPTTTTTTSDTGSNDNGGKWGLLGLLGLAGLAGLRRKPDTQTTYRSDATR